MGNGGNGRVGRPPVKTGNKQSKAAQRPSGEEELRRLRMLELARDAERRRNGLDAPVRAEKPSSPSALGSGSAPGFGKSSRKGRKKKARAAGHKEFPAYRPAPIADRGVDRRSGPPKIAPAYMR
ncbi:hypothetical protein SUDANB176_04507 [Streptomyces sp. enrichment culture]|uniref:hypothetical protein n=1 Tax=Streptomyces sp. enrichment culture TaxID=1795815 RepID=UPI003F565ED3